MQREHIASPAGGAGTLSVDGTQVAQGKIAHALMGRVPVDEKLDIGLDMGTPVVEDYADKLPFKFTGTIGKIVIQIGKSGHTAIEETMASV